MKIILAGGKTILACGKIILAGGKNYFGRWGNYFGRVGGEIILAGQVGKLFWHVGLVCPAGGTPLAEEFCDSGF